MYNARKHPKFINGEWSEAECFKHFLATFEAPEEKDGKVNLFYISSIFIFGGHLNSREHLIANALKVNISILKL